MSLSWIVLVVSGLLETVWASAPAESRGVTRPLPVVLFTVALLAIVAGVVGLEFAH